MPGAGDITMLLQMIVGAWPLDLMLEDTVGRHDFLLTPCSPETFSIIYKTAGHHPSCFENLVGALAPFGIIADRQPLSPMYLRALLRGKQDRGKRQGIRND